MRFRSISIASKEFIRMSLPPFAADEQSAVSSQNEPFRGFAVAVDKSCSFFLLCGSPNEGAGMPTSTHSESVRSRMLLHRTWYLSERYERVLETCTGTFVDSFPSSRQTSTQLVYRNGLTGSTCARYSNVPIPYRSFDVLTPDELPNLEPRARVIDGSWIRFSCLSLLHLFQSDRSVCNRAVRL
jgi:hypothetical protein